ncbi:MAG TPA: NUDIX domain-containing protein [Bacteroidia bacterium]|nr:NUDIX domain-containing protein [Bacteroidia bacterium]HNU34222.1 NUDIX domain-containing protein [Bacteroidia bacterium]
MFPFNVRVYGILINDKNEILLSDESYGNMSFTKFPGGGLEFGEGTIDGLKREFMEEMGAAIVVVDHFYTTDFFQSSAFNPQHQVISIYYRVKFVDPNFSPNLKSLRWKLLSKLNHSDVSLPIDKKVVQLINERITSPT